MLKHLFLDPPAPVVAILSCRLFGVAVVGPADDGQRGGPTNQGLPRLPPPSEAGLLFPHEAAISLLPLLFLAAFTLPLEGGVPRSISTAQPRANGAQRPSHVVIRATSCSAAINRHR
jgi:hypothetical protein